MRKTLLPALALVLITGLACASGGETSSGGPAPTDPGAARGTVPERDDDSSTPTARPAATSSRTTSVSTDPLTCRQLETASLGSATRRYNDYADPIPLVDGLWAGEDGAVVQLQWPCAIGELTGDQAADAVVPVLLDGGGTGKFWQIAVFGNVDGRPSYVTTTDIGDRTPIEQVSISGGQVTVVFLTRPDDPSSTVDLLRRTVTYRLTGDRLVENGRTDAPA